jgi:hypothetical protein
VNLVVGAHAAANDWPMVSGVWSWLTGPVRSRVARVRGWQAGRQERYLASLGTDDWLSSPEELERLTGTSKEDYERRLLAAAREAFLGEHIVECDGRQYTRQGALEAGSVDDVRMEGDGLDVEIVVLFRVQERPGRLFGWREPVWPTPTPDPDDSYTGPEGWADLLVIELWEDRGLVVPRTTGAPDPDGVTWLVPRG